MYASAAAYPLGDWAWMIEPANGASRQIHVSPDAVMLDVTALAPSILGSLATLLPSFLKPPTNDDALALARGRLERSPSMHDPAVKARRALYASLFPEEHPHAAQADADSAAELRNVDARALDAFVSTAIAADTVFVVANGDVDPDALVRVLEHELGALPQRAADATDARRTASCERSLARSDVRSGSLVAYGYPTVPASHPDAPALEVLAAAAGGDVSSRFDVALRHGLHATFGVYVSSTTMLHAGVFEILTTLAPDKVDEALEALDSEIERLREAPLSADELRVAKRRAIYARTAPDPALALASAISVERQPLSALDAVTADDVQAVARRYLDVSKRCAVTAETGSRAAQLRSRPGDAR